MLQHVKRSLGRTFVSLSYHQHFAVLVQELLVHVEQHLRRFSLTTQQGLGIIQRKITFLCIRLYSLAHIHYCQDLALESRLLKFRS